MGSAYFALKFFYENVLDVKFAEKLPLARKSQKLPLVLSKEEIYSIIDSTDNIKHKAIIMFLYYAGLRLNELINIRWTDIDFEREIIHLKRAKGDKERIIFLHKKLIETLRVLGIKNKGSVFISQIGRKYSKRAIQQIIRSVSVKAGIKTCNTTYTKAQFCYSSSGIRSRYQIYPAAAWTQGSKNHPDIYTCSK